MQFACTTPQNLFFAACEPVDSWDCSARLGTWPITTKAGGSTQGRYGLVMVLHKNGVWCLLETSHHSGGAFSFAKVGPRVGRVDEHPP